jgi:hypothetical protein
VARRFWCDAVLCGRRIFCEQFDDGVLGRYGRRTQRLETIVHHLGLALGGRPAAAFAARLMMPVSNDTLLRVVRRRIADQNDELIVIGIDDFAFRRGQTYGTIVCDLARRKPVMLLPDRALSTSRAWLTKRPSISIVARDRGGGYGEAIAQALPNARQVADRWHLMENSSRAFLDAVGKSMRQIRQAVGSNVVDPKLLTYTERLQYEGYLRRQETREAIRELSKKGTSIRQIVRQTGHSRKLFRTPCVASASMSFGRGPVRWTTGCLGSMTVGRKGHETPWHSGVRYERRAFQGKAALCHNGLSADDWRRKPIRVGLPEHHLPGSSHD